MLHLRFGYGSSGCLSLCDSDGVRSYSLGSCLRDRDGVRSYGDRLFGAVALLKVSTIDDAIAITISSRVALTVCVVAASVAVCIAIGRVHSDARRS